ncbi:hypothetical protein ACLOJK_032507 [Asimina triloba]
MLSWEELEQVKSTLVKIQEEVVSLWEALHVKDDALAKAQEDYSMLNIRDASKPGAAPSLDVVTSSDGGGVATTDEIAVPFGPTGRS